MIRKIYCDMDGVLTDFEGGFKKIFGVNMSTYKDQHDNESTWNAIDALGIDFWINLDWIPDGKILWDYITNLNMPIEILTKPSKNINSRLGKKIWVDRNLYTRPIINFSIDKGEYAMKDYILIDDYMGNEKTWVRNGGIFIHHTDWINTKAKLTQYLQ